MEQPLTVRWQNSDNYYTAMLAPDLFGGWTLVTASGARSGKNGRVREKPLASYEKGLEAMRQLRHRRRREGYELCGSAFAEFRRLDPRSPELRAAETQAVLRLFAAWQLGREEQAGLLGLDARGLDGYLDGRPLADDAVLLSRVGHLLAINKRLRRRYGEAADCPAEWLRLPNVKLGGRRPLDVMLASRAGLAALRRHLDAEAGPPRSRPAGPVRAPVTG
ncbi:DUF2384 domain-containing protein [Parasulfuritortus cantonensis]|uniref:DUF2384 domain-containing protein n=1 Tax=Parasulfuritortus cantonensis TaxID=2528202 RepID=A0A4R1BFB2_9PROT|nr:antitoxin Xre/MbcA/ParS toxin-binding domain-containing protein [Parasulfuritortus cantonensis]TCJ15797.1 DUF2384 domain-containing protein [Parasulfuritortus cantonensis]